MRNNWLNRPATAQRNRSLLPLAIAVIAAAVVAGCTNGDPGRAQSILSSPSVAASTPGTAAGPTSAPPSEPAGTAASPSAGTVTSAAGAADLESQYVATIRAVLPSVVLIQTDSGLGSGVVFDNNGHIVTNAHVVGPATAFRVTTAGSARPLAATLVGTFPTDDLAVIKVADAATLRPAVFADSSKVEVGDIVLAMGNPLGLSSSVTNGIVSAIGRTVTVPAQRGSPGTSLRDMIQTSADINPGNSGGALVNLAGEVVGIPTLAAVDQEAGGAAPGIGFAISSNVAKDIAAQLIEHGRVVDTRRAALGVTITTVADQQGIPLGAGIAGLVAGGPAETAGLQVGDVITGVAGQRVRSAQELGAVLATLQPGQAVPVEVQRDGGAQTFTVTLGTLPG